MKKRRKGRTQMKAKVLKKTCGLAKNQGREDDRKRKEKRGGKQFVLAGRKVKDKKEK